MADNLRDDIIDPHLNPQPLESPLVPIPGLGSLLSDLETAHGRIEERIRQLEAITSRFRQRQISTTVAPSAHPIMPHVHDNATHLPGVPATPETTSQTTKFVKRNGTYLIAKALSMDNDVRNLRSHDANFFDCNICLDTAIDPILTCCGHLFCWSCYYLLSYAHPNVKECPTCDGEVADTSIIPIYGNGGYGVTYKSKAKELGSYVPPRPRAHRIESIRQQILNQRALSPSIEERIPHFQGTWSTDLGSAQVTTEMTSQISHTSEREGTQQHPSLQVSRLLLQGAASFSSLSSALNSAMNSAERLVQDLEAYVGRHNVRRSQQEPQHVHREGSFPNIIPASQSEYGAPDIAVRMNSMASHTALPFRASDDVAPVAHTDNQMPLSSTSRQRAEASSGVNADEEFSSERRRRRLI